MAEVRHDLTPAPPPDKFGLPGITYPTNDKAEYVTVVEEVEVAGRNYTDLPRYTAHPGTGGATGIAEAVVTLQRPSKGTGNRRMVRRVYETLPGPPLSTSRIDPQDGSVIQEVRRAVRAIPPNTATSVGTSSVRYELRDPDNPLVDWEITSTTALDGVVRSTFTRVNLRLPRVLAGIVVSYTSQKGVGDDDSEASGSATSSVRFSASARGSSSLSISPEVFLPIRDYSDRAENVPAYVKQVFLTGAISEAALLTKLSAVYEVVVSGTLSPAAGGTYLGNSSNRNGVLWFSQTTYVLFWESGNWKLGTEAGIAAGNYWKRTAAATSWLGTYTAQGTNTGTATVAAGRTVNAWPQWATQEVNLITAGKSASVSSNASASKDVKADGIEFSLSLSHGFSVSTGINQSRIRVDPTLHGELIIANPSYTDTVNATAAATLPAIPGGTSTGISSGFGGDSHAQTVRSYVLPVRRPTTSPADIPQSGLYALPNYSPSAKDAQYTSVLATVVDFTYFAQAPAEIGYSDPAPNYSGGIAITPNQPYYLGGTPASWGISPTILAGLTLNTSTGVITGTPSIGSAPVVYTVTATNAQGSITTTVTISATAP